MRRFVCLLSLGASLFLVGACQSPQPQSDYRPTATIKDIMDSIVDPSADVIWNSVATIVSVEGVEERQPKTDEEWAEVRRAAVRLVEATNLLIMPDRKVARMGEKSANPKIELEPQEIEKLITDDRPAWYKLAGALHNETEPALRAIDARDVQGIIDAGEKIDTACENCQLKYWYPSQLELKLK